MNTRDTLLDNPLLAPWTAPHGLPPFDAIRAEHFEPAFEAAMREHRAELDAIAAQPEAPTFDNTVARLDASGRAFARIDGVFHNLCASETSEALQAAQRALAQPMAAHSNALYLNAPLFARLEALHAQRDSLAAGRPSSSRLLERTAPATSCAPARARLAPDGAGALCAGAWSGWRS